MFHNFFFLRRLSKQLNNALTESILIECFSQNKDELILGFSRKEKSDFFIKASLEQDLGLLSFPEDFKRARKNSVDLFQELVGLKIEKIDQFEFERSFVIKFENGFDLIFKMHGGRSNILLARNSHVVRIFRSNLIQDLHLDPNSLNRKLDLHSQEDLEHLGRVLGPELRNEFPDLLNLTIAEIQSQLALLDECPLFVAVLKKPDISFVHLPNSICETLDAIEACNELFRYTTGTYVLERLKTKRAGEIKKAIVRSENYISKSEQKIEELKKGQKYDEIANIIMANLHAIPPNSSNVTLHDFYRDCDILIKLKPSQSPQKLAENYYRKSKNQRLEIDNLESNIRQKKTQVQDYLTLLSKIEKTETVKGLRKLENIPEISPLKSTHKPYNEYELMGFRIWVGKNAKSNDELTFRYGKKNDLWLHAKDVSGSHVLVKEIAGQVFPKPVIERAAELAAYNSRRKTDSLCPVIYTPRKFVRKIKGAPVGQVVVDREDIVMIEPKP